jgi:hypothetical protein
VYIIVGRLFMDSNTPSKPEHAFIPADDTITVVFASVEKARSAISGLTKAGIPSDEVELVTRADHQVGNVESPSFKQDTPGIEGFDEILHACTESFSDDEKAYVEFDRRLAAGGALLSLSMAGRQDRRSEVASLLRSHGASAIYYWGVLATEQL